MAHQGESSARNRARRPSNPSGHFTPSVPTPATVVGAQASQALFQENQCEASMAMAPHTFHFQPGSQQPHWTTMPQAGGVPSAMPPLQHSSGTAAVQPLHGDELAARVAAINTLPYQPFEQPYNYAHGWSQVEQGNSGNPMVAMAPNSNNSGAAPPVAADGYGGATSWTHSMLAPSGWPGSSWAPPVQQPGAGGQASWAWAPPAQQQRPGMPPPASPPASGSAQAPPLVTTTGKKGFQEFLLEAGVLDEQTLEKIFLDELAEEMLGDGGGQAERDDRWVSLGDVLLALGAVSASSSGAGPSTRRQVRMPAREALGAAAGTGTTGGGDDQAAAAAAEARERRSRRMAKRKEAASRHYRAAPRGSQNGPGAI